MVKKDLDRKVTFSLLEVIIVLAVTVVAVVVGYEVTYTWGILVFLGMVLYGAGKTLRGR